jgi:hypothetical protein
VIDPRTALTAVSCPTRSLCIAVDDSGDEATSKDPTAGRRAWRVAGVDGDNSFTGLSCPSVQLCVGVDAEAYSEGDSGDILTATRPAHGGSSWRTTFTDNDNNFGTVACSSRALCLAGDEGGNLLVSTRPARSSSWVMSGAPAGGSIDAISCVGASLCVAVDSGGDVISSTDLPR